MKKLFYMLICLMAVTAAYAQKNNNPLSYPYYICGTTTIDPNDGTVILRDISYKGFSCKEEYFKTGAESNEKAVFRFERITTNPAISLAGKRLQYWRQDESGAWMTDEEGGNGIAENKLNKYMTIMLVLDCSKSLGNDFDKVKQGAISFIKKLQSVSSSDYVRFGIIGFSSIAEVNRQTFSIRPLNSSTYYEAVNFINSLSADSNTALYYAMDKAVEMLEEYVNGDFGTVSTKEYEGTYMLTFTDGLDNSSQFREKKIFTSKQAYEYTKERLTQSQVKGTHIESYIIGARGVDLKTGEQISKFKNELEGFTCGDGRFIYLENMQNLQSTFTDIAEGLVKKWQNLLCYTSLAHEGGVCWTYGDAAYVAPKPSYTYRNTFLGLNAGVGFGITAYDSGPMFSVGIEYAHPVSQKFGIGCYAEYNGIISAEDSYVVSGGAVGIMTTIGNYHDGYKAFVGGIGMAFDEDYGVMFNLRGGGMFRNGLYLMGEISTGSGSGETWDNYYDPNDGSQYTTAYYTTSGFAFNASIKIGYNFGRFIKVRKKR